MRNCCLNFASETRHADHLAPRLRGDHSATFGSRTGPYFFAIEAKCSAKPAFFVALALFELTFSVCAAFLSSMRRAPQELTRGWQNSGD
jgi:hypothetical protein